MRIVSNARATRLAYQQQIGRDISLSEISEITGISPETIRRLEQNEAHAIGFETLAKLCKFYGVSVGDLLVVQGD
jgi:DNA-binding Xre family transcriptional regulator